MSQSRNRRYENVLINNYFCKTFDLKCLKNLILRMKICRYLNKIWILLSHSLCFIKLSTIVLSSILLNEFRLLIKKINRGIGFES